MGVAVYTEVPAAQAAVAVKVTAAAAEVAVTVMPLDEATVAGVVQSCEVLISTVTTCPAVRLAVLNVLPLPEGVPFIFQV